jgi:hypothetical protein
MRVERFRARITADSRGHAVITIPFDPDEAWPAGHSGTRSRATRPAASGGHETHLDLPADLPLNPRYEKPGRRRPMITPWVCFAPL